MEITFDPAKNEDNIVKRSLAFEQAKDSDFDTALFEVDNRRDYGEVRYRALGLLDGQLHALVFTETKLDIRVMSFRKANARERQHDETQTQS